MAAAFANPFRPGAGHMPPHLAGRTVEREEFKRLLEQETVLENLILTGLRGVGKTVLLETLKPEAMKAGWLWVGTDLSEASSLTEERMVTRLLTDLSVVTSNYHIQRESVPFGLEKPTAVQQPLDYELLVNIYNSQPGLVSDKLKHVLEKVHELLGDAVNGILFAYDEAQVLSDHSEKDEFPMSLLLDVFQSIQKKGIRYMLALTGLPTLFPKLVESRTYAERMFRVVQLERLSDDESRDAVAKPIEDAGCTVVLTEDSVSLIVKLSGGYPYFIQFICREVYDVFIQNPKATVPADAITRKLDTDFFSGGWARITDRQKDLMVVISKLESCEEFTVQDASKLSGEILDKKIGSSQVNQILAALSKEGLIYKNRHGRYSFAVPMMGKFIERHMSS